MNPKNPRPKPIAPPAFRPQPTPKVLQTKMAVAPPVYRPQAKQIVQRAAGGGGAPLNWAQRLRATIPPAQLAAQFAAQQAAEQQAAAQRAAEQAAAASHGRNTDQ